MDGKFGIPQMTIPDHILYDLVSCFPENANLKDINTKKYLCCNKNSVKLCGLTDPNETIGLTVHDLDKYMKPYEGRGFADTISDLDDLVAKECKVITNNDSVFVDRFGLIHLEKMTKAPIANTSNKITAIFTMSFEITEKMDKLVLFSMYRDIYPNKRESCSYFMDHLKIKTFFRDILSEKEMCCLLFMLENKSYKYIAGKMNIGLKTVETHISNIANKADKKDLSAVLEYLRTSNNIGKIHT